MKYLLSFALIGVLFAASAQNIDPLWAAHDTTNGSSFYYQIPILMVDTLGNIIMSGETYGAGPVIGVYTTKRSPDGQILWTKYYDMLGQDFLKSAVTDSAGAVYVLANTRNQLSNTSQFIIIKYDADGNETWRYFYSNSSTIRTVGANLLLTPEQELIVVGSYNDSDPEMPSRGLLAVKLDADMNEIWRTLYINDDAQFGLGALQAAFTGDKIQIWGTRGGNNGIRFFSWQVDMQGNALGAHTATVPYADDFGGAIHIDRQGNLFLGDYVGEYKVTKYDTLANHAWTYRKPFIDRPNTTVDARLECIESDQSGNLYIGGIYNVDSIVGIMAKIITKLDPDGNLVWEEVYFGPDSILDIGANKAGWISDELLLFTGVYVADASIPSYQVYLDVYDANGPKWAGRSEIAGQRNSPSAIIADGPNFYVAGTFTIPMPGVSQTGYFLCKYPLSVVNTIQHLKEQVSVSGLRIAPNPVETGCRVLFNSDKADKAGRLAVFDELGRPVYSAKMEVTAGENTHTLDNLPLPAGKYALCLYAGGKVFSGILVKQ